MVFVLFVLVYISVVLVSSARHDTLVRSSQTENFQFQKLMYAPEGSGVKIPDEGTMKRFNAIDIMSVISVLAVFVVIIGLARYSQPDPKVKVIRRRKKHRS
jgi:hypothetical protein